MDNDEIDVNSPEFDKVLWQKIAEDRHKEGWWKGIVVGLLIGTIGIPAACSLLPKHFREALRETMQTEDGAEQGP